MASFIVGISLMTMPSVSYAEGGGGAKIPKPKTTFDKEDVSIITGTQFAEEGDPVYLNLPPLVIPIINDSGAQQLVSMLIDLQVRNVESAELLKSKDPILKDALVTAMYKGLSDGTMRNAAALDIPAIKNQIKITVNEIFDGDHVLHVLIQAVSQRKL